MTPFYGALCGLVLACSLLLWLQGEKAIDYVLGILVGAAILFLLSPKANAQESGSINFVGAGVHIGSHHWPSNGYNNSNPGVYLLADVSGPGILAGSYAIGTYFNSERKQSAYLVRSFSLYPYVDLSIGLVTGYRRGVVVPMVVPSVRVPIGDGYTLRIAGIPAVENNGKFMLVGHVMLERKF